MTFLRLSQRWRSALLVLLILAGATLIWSKSITGALLAAAGVLELQEKTLARVTGLFKAGGSAQKDVDQATSDEQTAEGNFKAAKDAVRIFGKTDADIEQLLASRRIVSTLVVPSPISGRVVARSAAPGFLTEPSNAPAPFQVADISTMWMIANVIETDAPAYRVGQPVEVRVPAYPDKAFQGHVTAVGSIIDASTHRQLVRSRIDDPEHLLRSGMYASFVIRFADQRALPRGACGGRRPRRGRHDVNVGHHRQPAFPKRTVATGMRQDGWTQILDGLRAGETVVTEGAAFLSNKLALGNRFDDDERAGNKK